MKKVMYAAVAMLLMAGAVSCKKSGEETKSTDNQTETMASVSSDNTSNSGSVNADDAVKGEISDVDAAIKMIEDAANKMKSAKNATEFGRVISQEATLTTEQRAYVLTEADKERLKEAYRKSNEILFPLAVKYGFMTEKDVNEHKNDYINAVDNATTLGSLF